MPVIVTTLLGIVGSTLLKMVVSAVSADMVKYTVIQALEFALHKYEERARKSPESEDDNIAFSLREGLEKLKHTWEKV